MSSLPNKKEVLHKLLNGEMLAHKQWIEEHDGHGHRLSAAISLLRHKCGYLGIIQCPRGKNHPMANHYFIALGDMKLAHELAKERGLLYEE